MKLIISKRMVLSLVLLALVYSGFAQAVRLPKIEKQAVKKESAKGSGAKAAKETVEKSKNEYLKLKKDGTPDKRYVVTYKKASFSKFALTKIDIVNKETRLAYLARTDRDSVFKCDDPENTKPIRLGKLNEIEDEFFDVTNDRELNLSLFKLINGKVGRNDQLVEMKFLLFKDYPCTPSSTRILAGFSVNFQVSGRHIDLTDLKLKDFNLSGKLKKTKISYKTHYYGLCEIVDYGELPTSGTLTSESLTAIKALADKLKKALNKNTIVDPVVWPDYGTLQARLYKK